MPVERERAVREEKVVWVASSESTGEMVVTVTFGGYKPVVGRGRSWGEVFLSVFGRDFTRTCLLPSVTGWRVQVRHYQGYNITVVAVDRNCDEISAFLLAIFVAIDNFRDQLELEEVNETASQVAGDN